MDVKIIFGKKKQDIEIPSNLTLQSGISNRHSRTKGNTTNGNVNNENIEEEHKHEATRKGIDNHKNYRLINAIIHKNGKFLEVICRRCGNKQIVYGKSTTDVKCLKCNKLLVKTGGGKARIVTFVRRVLIWK